MMKSVYTKSTWKGGMLVEGQTSDHTLTIDQPTDMGGEDAGPNPMEYLLIALGSCLGSVAAILAKQEGIDLREFSVEIDGEYDVEFLMGKTTQGRSGFTEIRETVHIEADMTDQEKAAFFEKVHLRCPVTDNLYEQTPIVYEVK